MQDHPNPGSLLRAPRPGTAAHRVQRAVLLELVTSPPANGDVVAVLPAQLDEPAALVDSAIDALVAVGLARFTGTGWSRPAPPHSVLRIWG
jgi:hypothetical protein